MPRSRKLSPQTQSVLIALSADPARWRYGYDLAGEVNLKSGSLYPILVRLADRGLLESQWESGPAGRPPRHIYRLSARGLEQASQFAAAIRPNKAVRTARVRRPAPHASEA